MECVDYNDIFSIVVKYSSICITVPMVAHFNMELEQMDVKIVFIHGDLNETIYLQQPISFVIQ